MSHVFRLMALSALILLTFQGQTPILAQEDEVERLKSKVQNLQDRVENLEEKISRIEKLISSNSAPHQEANSKGWRNQQNWRDLRKGMSKREVRQILGEPGKISSGSYGENWYYPDAIGGNVDFNSHGKVEGWSEP